MNRQKPRPPLLTTPCPFPGCDSELRAVFFPRTLTIRGYHDEDALIDMVITDLKPDHTPDAATLDRLQETAMVLWGYQMGAAVGEHHAERMGR